MIWSHPSHVTRAGFLGPWDGMGFRGQGQEWQIDSWRWMVWTPWLVVVDPNLGGIWWNEGDFWENYCSGSFESARRRQYLQNFYLEALPLPTNSVDLPNFPLHSWGSWPRNDSPVSPEVALPHSEHRYSAAPVTRWLFDCGWWIPSWDDLPASVAKVWGLLNPVDSTGEQPMWLADDILRRSAWQSQLTRRPGLQGAKREPKVWEFYVFLWRAGNASRATFFKNGV